ncbi:hypothetical protein TGMAS_202735 [Toxoplasma gondii MAS]|uniref:Uncharacterized protein n=1 Tax=Toxoplasma gondii MAS TaxID=943118 RepID=A0A086Q9P7_TOXGO|nr:hypothetical protein TGMAS_202735 [Toxoplasma gondii MAS]
MRVLKNCVTLRSVPSRFCGGAKSSFQIQCASASGDKPSGRLCAWTAKSDMQTEGETEKKQRKRFVSGRPRSCAGHRPGRRGAASSCRPSRNSPRTMRAFGASTARGEPGIIAR